MTEQRYDDLRPLPAAGPPGGRAGLLKGAALLLLVAAAVAAGVWWWMHRLATEPAIPVGVPPAVVQGAAAPAVSASGPQNPVDALAVPDPALPTLAQADPAMREALVGLVGERRVLELLQIDGFIRRVVATVDNLPQEQAPSRMWPVHPAPDRFTVAGSGADQHIAPSNAARYSALVGLAEAVSIPGAVALYARWYPLFQQAYEELGYPGRYFNDRLVAVIDHLLLAPEPAGPVHVTLTQVKGNVPSERPWVRYEYADPRLQALSSGQKMLVRVGPENERRLKARLTELRRQLATGAAGFAKPGAPAAAAAPATPPASR